MGQVASTLVVVGGGAAGFFCAVNAARLHSGMRVVLLEKTGKLLSKVKVSGGGRCNVTHNCDDIEEMIQAYPRGKFFLRKAFHQFFTTDTIAWFADRGVRLVTEKDGRMFPSTNSSQTIIDCLLHEADRYGVEIRFHSEVKAIAREGSFFRISMSNGEQIASDYVCAAPGGMYKPDSFRWLAEQGHQIIEPVPSLFTFNMPGHPITQLQGISVPDAHVRLPETGLRERGPLLITHWGLSGPAVLRLSAWGARELHARAYKFRVLVNWLPAIEQDELKTLIQSWQQERGHSVIANQPFRLPARLWAYLVSQAGISSQLRWSELRSTQRNKLITQISSDEFQAQGKTSFKEEFVTAGGISLGEIDPHTMQSRLVPGLHFAGEVMDVDGITGGYNFQHAWTSGWISAASLSQ